MPWHGPSTRWSRTPERAAVALLPVTTYSSVMNTPARLPMRSSLLVILCLVSAPVLAQKGVPATSVVVGGRPMASDHDIVDNLSQSPDLSTFTGLLRLAGLADALQGHGPFTVFAPTNAAFAALPAGVVDGLRRPENKTALVSFVSEHILPGNYSLARLRYLLRASKGPTELDTLNEGKVTVSANGLANLTVRGPKGDPADIMIYDVKQSNGVLFVTDRVLQPG